MIPLAIVCLPELCPGPKVREDPRTNTGLRALGPSDSEGR
jgi:hypothetical protein